MSFNLSALAVREKSITLFFILVSIIGGLYAFLSLGRAEDPSFTIRAMVVSVQWPGASAEQIQQQVVDRLEKRIQEVHNVHRIDSQLQPGQANLTIEFKDYTPSAQIPDLFYQVRKRMQEEQAYLPAGVLGPQVNDSFADVYFSLMSLSAPGLPFRELSRQAEKLRDHLIAIDGVEKAQLIGDRAERVYVEFDTAKMAALGVSMAQVQQQLAGFNQLLPAGYMKSNGPQLLVRLSARADSLDEFGALPLNIHGAVIRLSDIATIKRGYEDPARFLVRTAGDDAILLGIVMKPGENGLALGKKVASFLQQYQQQLPLGMHIHQLTNQANAIAAAVDVFEIKFLLAVAVVMLVSIWAIGLKAGIVVGIAIPLTLGLTFLLMKTVGINLDRITLGALIIALGLLVDDAIIAIEMMMVKMEQGMARLQAASYAWSATAAPMLFGTLVTIVGFVPVGFAKSGVGEYTGNIFWVIGFALLISWLVAVTFTPYLGVKLLPQQHHASVQHNPYQSAHYQRFRQLVTWCVTHKRVVLLATLGGLVLSMLSMATTVQKQFFPSSDRPEVLISVYMPNGTHIDNTDATVRQIEQYVKTLPGVRSMSAYIGAGAPRFFISANPEQPNAAFAKLLLVAEDTQQRDQLVQQLQQWVDAGHVSQARVRISGLLYGPPVAWPVSFRVLGPDPQVLRQIASQVRQVMAQDANLVAPHFDWDERQPMLQLQMNVDALARHGFTPADIAQQLQWQLGGSLVSQLREDIRQVAVVARLAQQQVKDLHSIELKTSQGHSVALHQLGDIHIQYEEPLLKRINRHNYLAIHADVSGAQPNDVSNRVWQQLQPLVNTLPVGYQLQQAGVVEESGKADASIQRLMPLMVVLMLVFIMLQMRSFTGTLIVVATAPLGLIGATLALLVFAKPFGFVALLGLIGLAGILMRNTLILTQQVSDNLSEGLPFQTAVIEAAVQRARPVLLTALAAMLAFVPLTFDTFWGPMAYVLIGGVGVGTVITLCVVPALYMLLYPLRRHHADTTVV